MSNLVLYRKYRPLDFASVISQEHVKTTLKNAVTNNKAGHAYLFTGPRGVGKTTIARIFARAVNCRNLKNGEPCNTCDICKQFLNNTSLDLIEIDAASHTGVDNIRELIDHLKFSPTSATYKVIIVDEVHMLSKGAFNALLKTLEEPPKHAIFILATTEIHKVPATIISRTQRFDFKKSSLADLTRLLTFVADDNKISITKEAIFEIATAADGSFRDSLSLLDQVMNFSDGAIDETLVEQVLGLISIKTTSKFLQFLIESKAASAVSFVSKLLYDGIDLYQFQKDFLEYLRKVLLVKMGNLELSEFTEEVRELIIKQSKVLELPQLIKIIEAFQKAGNDLKWVSVQSLPLELAVLEVTTAPVEHPNKEASIAAIVPSDIPAERVTPLEETIQSSDSQDDFEKIKNRWPEILEKIKDYNHSLLSSMKLAVPKELSGKDLILVFPYTFHKDTIEARKNRIVIDQVIEEVTGLKVMTKPVLEKDLKNIAAAGENKNDLVKSALEIFGGEVEG